MMYCPILCKDDNRIPLRALKMYINNINNLWGDQGQGGVRKGRVDTNPRVLMWMDRKEWSFLRISPSCCWVQ
jgi:hypothetical protein